MAFFVVFEGNKIYSVCLALKLIIKKLNGKITLAEFYFSKQNKINLPFNPNDLEVFNMSAIFAAFPVMIMILAP